MGVFRVGVYIADFLLTAVSVLFRSGTVFSSFRGYNWLLEYKVI